MSTATISAATIGANDASGALAGASARTPSGGLLHAAKEFESMLLTQWLQAAETTFASTPGADDDADGADLQMKGYAVQALAKGITEAGGIGLSSLVAQALSKEPAGAEHTSVDATRMQAKAATIAEASGEQR